MGTQCLNLNSLPFYLTCYLFHGICFSSKSTYPLVPGNGKPISILVNPHKLQDTSTPETESGDSNLCCLTIFPAYKPFLPSKLTASPTPYRSLANFLAQLLYLFITVIGIFPAISPSPRKLVTSNFLSLLYLKFKSLSLFF